MKNILLFGLFLSMIGCSNDDSPAQVNISASVFFSVLDSEGNDLLNPQNPNAINTSTIKVFYIIDGVAQEINRSNLDNPKMFKLSPPEDNDASLLNKYYFIGLNLNIEEKAATTTTLFQWDTNTTDTFEADLSRGDNDGFIICTKVIYNGNVVYEVATAEGIPFFEIVR